MLIRSLTAAMALSALVLAQDDAAQSQSPPTPARFVDMYDLPGGQIQSTIQEWLRDREITLGMQEDGAFVAAQVEPVSLSTSADAWGAARIAAYRRLEQRVRASFLEFLRVSVSAETVAELVRDDGVRDRLLNGRPEDFEAEIDAKTRALSAAELDSALRELGVPDERIGELTATQKHVEMRDAIERRSTSRAIGRISGMRPLKTFEGEDRVGNYSVAMIAVWSPRQQALAERILRGDTGPAGDGETIGISIDELFQGDNGRITGNEALTAMFADEYGVRMVTDRDGRQAIVAFAQSAPQIKVTDSAVRKQRAVAAAKQGAEKEARVMIQEFLALAMEASTEMRSGEVYEKYLLEQRDGRVDDVSESVALTNWLKNRVRSSVDGVQVGVHPVETWQGNHPIYGHPLVGVISVWSPSSAELAAFAARGGTPEQRGAEGGGTQPDVRGSRDFEGGKKKKPKW